MICFRVVFFVIYFVFYAQILCVFCDLLCVFCVIAISQSYTKYYHEVSQNIITKFHNPDSLGLQEKKNSSSKKELTNFFNFLMLKRQKRHTKLNIHLQYNYMLEKRSFLNMKILSLFSLSKTFVFFLIYFVFFV